MRALAAEADRGRVAEHEGGRAVAERLAGEAKLRFDARDYVGAIAGYGAAYRHHPSPGLLFNLAQAFRLRGDCAAATLTYHHYLRAEPGSPYRDVVETHLETLAPCAHDQTLAASRDAASPGRGRRTAGVALGVAGLVLLVGGHAMSDDGGERGGDDDRRLGAALMGAGAATAVTGITLYALGHRADRSARRGFTLQPAGAGVGAAAGFTASW